MNVVCFRILDWPSTAIKRKDGGGVTVLDLVAAICRFFNSPNCQGISLRAACPWDFDPNFDWIGDGPDPNFKAPKDRTAKYIEMLGDRNGWTGFERVLKDRAGRLLLHTVHFDSW